MNHKKLAALLVLSAVFVSSSCGTNPQSSSATSFDSSHATTSAFSSSSTSASSISATPASESSEPPSIPSSSSIDSTDESSASKESSLIDSSDPYSSIQSESISEDLSRSEEESSVSEESKFSSSENPTSSTRSEESSDSSPEDSSLTSESQSSQDSHEGLTPTEGLQYRLNSDGTGYIFTLYRGDAETIVIASEYNGLPVLEIGDGINSVISSPSIYRGAASRVIIPDSVVSINASAFLLKSQLISLTIGKNVEKIGNNAFSTCEKLVEIYNLSSLVLEKGSEDFGSVARYAKDIYTSQDAPSKIMITQEGHTLYQSDQEVDFLSASPRSTFLDIPEGVTSIHPYACVNNLGIVQVTLPSTLQSIGDYAFYYCYKLIEVINHSELALAIGSESAQDYRYFGGILASALSVSSSSKESMLTYEYPYVSYMADDGLALAAYLGEEEHIAIAGKFTIIGGYAFYWNKVSTSVSFSEGTTTIKKAAFSNCNFTSISFPASLTHLDSGVLDSTNTIKSVVFADTMSWKVYRGAADLTGTEISPESLSDPAQAATYLRATYRSYIWEKSKAE